MRRTTQIYLLANAHMGLVFVAYDLPAICWENHSTNWVRTTKPRSLLRGKWHNELNHLLPSRLYCRPWNYTKSTFRLAGFTAGEELHLALKINYYLNYVFIICYSYMFVKSYDKYLTTRYY